MIKAEIMKLDKFVSSWGQCFEKETVEALLRMQPGEHKIIERVGFKIVFVRVTKFHMAKMDLAEFNGEK